MATLQQLLVADNAGPAARRLYENSGKALALMVPAAYFTDRNGAMQKLLDLALAPVIVYHSHVSMNCIISDYVPPPVRSKSTRILPIGPVMERRSAVEMGCAWSQWGVSARFDEVSHQWPWFDWSCQEAMGLDLGFLAVLEEF